MHDYDCLYSPFDEALSWLSRHSPSTALVVGQETDDIAGMITSAAIDEARSVNPRGALRRLHDGVYVFQEDGGWHSLWVSGGQPATGSAQGVLRLADDHLGESLYTWQDHWDQAKPLVGAAAVGAGMHVR